MVRRSIQYLLDEGFTLKIAEEKANFTSENCFVSCDVCGIGLCVPLSTQVHSDNEEIYLPVHKCCVEKLLELYGDKIQT